MYKLLITDLDDTLYSWLGFFIPAFFGMVSEVSRLTGIDTEVLLDEYRTVHQEKGSVEYPFSTLLLPSVTSVLKGKNREEMKTALQPAFDRFNELRNENLILFPGVQDTLATLKKSGVSVIGFTDSGELNGFYRLLLLGISDLFTKVYVTNYDYPLPEYIVRDHKVFNAPRGKPDPKLLEGIVKKEGLNKNEVLYMGDSLTKDIYMAHKAGIRCVQCRYPLDFNASEYYQKLVRISSWTDEVFARERALQDICRNECIHPDYTLTDYNCLLDIIGSRQ